METHPKKSSIPFIALCICVGLGGIALASYLADIVGFIEDMIYSWAFALIGGMTFVALVRTRHLAWRLVTFAAWFIAISTFGSFLGSTLDLHSGLVAGIILPAIGVLIYGLFTYFPAPPRAVQAPSAPLTSFRALGDPDRRVDPLQNPAERDVPIQHASR